MAYKLEHVFLDQILSFLLTANEETYCYRFTALLVIH